MSNNLFDSRLKAKKAISRSVHIWYLPFHDIINWLFWLIQAEFMFRSYKIYKYSLQSLPLITTPSDIVLLIRACEQKWQPYPPY